MSQFEAELADLGVTYGEALTHEVGAFSEAIASAGGASVIGVGSGGSYTVASVLCNLHEAASGRVSRPSTPLEIICNPTLAKASPVFLISAEGNNPDITEALARARLRSARTIHVLTNKPDSRLTTLAASMRAVRTHLFPLSKKDGYLATHTLILNSVVIARAYQVLGTTTNRLPERLDELEVAGRSVGDWLGSATDFLVELSSRNALIILYSPLLRPIAADLESKLSEAALVYCQCVDFRSFAHGRHLWLANRHSEVAILAITDESTSALWAATKSLFPERIPTLTLDLSGAPEVQLVTGLLAELRLVGEIGRMKGLDPGRPIVPGFGRQMYQLEIDKMIPGLPEHSPVELSSKFEVLGAQWPAATESGQISRAGNDYLGRLKAQTFRAIVFDYDGTLCDSQARDAPPAPSVVDQLRRIIAHGVFVGIASGRGGSIQEWLSASLQPQELSKIRLALYSGGWISTASEPPLPDNRSSEFISQVRRIANRLRAHGAPISGVHATQPFQVSIRFKEGVATDVMWFVVADALREAGLDVSRVVKSKHSIDVLGKGVGKAELIAHMIETFSLDPYQILAIGDQGAWPGNDYSLLEHRFSLSVDVPSRRLDRGWNFAPPHKRDVDATLWYMDKLILVQPAQFRLSF